MKKTAATQLEAARVLLAEIAVGLEEDHTALMSAECGSMDAHHEEEPTCSYCDWIKRAVAIAPEHAAVYKSITR